MAMALTGAWFGPSMRHAAECSSFTCFLVAYEINGFFTFLKDKGVFEWEDPQVCAA